MGSLSQSTTVAELVLVSWDATAASGFRVAFVIKCHVQAAAPTVLVTVHGNLCQPRAAG